MAGSIQLLQRNMFQETNLDINSMLIQLAWGKDYSFKLFRILCTKVLLLVVSLFEEMWVPKSKFRIVLVSVYF